MKRAVFPTIYCQWFLSLWCYGGGPANYTVGSSEYDMICSTEDVEKCLESMSEIRPSLNGTALIVTFKPDLLTFLGCWHLSKLAKLVNVSKWSLSHISKFLIALQYSQFT